LEIRHKGFTGKILFSKEAASFYGEVENSANLIAFQASTPQAAIEAMHIAVDQYLRYLSVFAKVPEMILEAP